MKYFKNSAGRIFAFEIDGSQDDLISDDLKPVSESDIANANAAVDPKERRNIALQSQVHDFGDGRVIQCRPHPFSDENNMRNAIEQMVRLNQSERLWFGADNSIINVTADDLKAAIQSGQDQSDAIWAEFFEAIEG